MTEKSDMIESEKRYEFVGEIKRILESLTSSMYEFRGRMEKIHRSMFIIEGERIPRLPANVDRELNYKSLGSTCDYDYFKRLINTEVNWPVYKFEATFRDKCSGILTNLQKTYSDVVQRKHHYGAKLFVAYNAYKRGLNRIKQQHEQLQDIIRKDNARPGLVRWLQKDLQRVKAEVETQQNKLTKYIEHKKNVGSKFFTQTQSLSEQLCNIEQMCTEQVRKIMTETITNYATILKYGRPQQQQLASESIHKKLYHMDPDEKAAKWLETEIGLLYITSDLNLELMTLDDEEACPVSSKIHEVAQADINTLNISDESGMVSGDHGDNNEPLRIKSESLDVAKESDATTTWVRFDGDQLSPRPASVSSVSWPEIQNQNDEQTASTTNDIIGFNDNCVPRNACNLSNLKVRVTSSYERCDKSHITLRPGMIIKQKHLANTEGMCYGYKRTRLGLKRHGMYPAHCIEQVHVDQ